MNSVHTLHTSNFNGTLSGHCPQDVQPNAHPIKLYTKGIHMGASKFPGNETYNISIIITTNKKFVTFTLLNANKSVFFFVVVVVANDASHHQIG